ncbi:RNA polymerase II transcription factor B subunit 5 [Penicillium rolfsii]|nr:RNA polymerase II transcription factor B subunit 5 [Penicillium rolfsii]
MPRAVRGLLIECDPSIKAMILKYDEERHDYIVEDLDDENHLVIKESQLENLKARLDHVCFPVEIPKAHLAVTANPHGFSDERTNTVAGSRRENHAAGRIGIGIKLSSSTATHFIPPSKHRCHRGPSSLSSRPVGANSHHTPSTINCRWHRSPLHHLLMSAKRLCWANAPYGPGFHNPDDLQVLIPSWIEFATPSTMLVSNDPIERAILKGGDG